MHVTGTQTVTHEYLTLNGKVARETIRTNNTLTGVLDFIYDESGKPFALKYSTNGTSFQTYYYVLNLQGDVVKLVQKNGDTVGSSILECPADLCRARAGRSAPDLCRALGPQHGILYATDSRRT